MLLQRSRYERGKTWRMSHTVPRVAQAAASGARVKNGTAHEPPERHGPSPLLPFVPYKGMRFPLSLLKARIAPPFQSSTALLNCRTALFLRQPPLLNAARVGHSRVMPSTALRAACAPRLEGEGRCFSQRNKDSSRVGRIAGAVREDEHGQAHGAGPLATVGHRLLGKGEHALFLNFQDSTTGGRMRLPTTERQLWHCGAHTAKPESA